MLRPLYSTLLQPREAGSNFPFIVADPSSREPELQNSCLGWRAESLGVQLRKEDDGHEDEDVDADGDNGDKALWS